MMTKRLRWETILLAAILLASLALRLYRLDAFLAGDETKWICRGINFHDALRRGDLKATYQSEHPGVATMWLTTLAVPLAEAGDWCEYCAATGGDQLTRVPTEAMLRLPELIAQARRLLAIVTWVGIVALALLLRRLFGDPTALFAAVFLAFDPFYLALSRVLHLDALLSTFMTLSAASLLVYQHRGQQPRYLVASALAGGLAIANKSPGGFLALWTALTLGATAWRGDAADRKARLVVALKRLLLWGAIAGGLVIILWPSLWVNPLGTLQNVLGSAVGYAEEPHGNSNYFWFAIRPDPGPAFYPVAWAFRTTPWVMLGLAALLLLRKHSDDGAPLIWLASYALLYGLLMTLGAKKFDRYGLPAYLPFDIIAAAGWAAFLRGIARPRRAIGAGLFSPSGRRVGVRAGAGVKAGLAALLAVGQLVLFLPRQPYYFSYYNPVVGGARTAIKVLLVGWGEGLEKAAAYLNVKPGAEQFRVNTAHIGQFAPYFVGETSSSGDVDMAEADYYVFYWNVIQRQRDAEVLNLFYGVRDPEYVVTEDGIDYVYIYANNLCKPAVDYIAERADPQRDVIVLDVNASLLRHYQGATPIVAVDGTVSEDVLLARLAEVPAGRQRVWHLTFDETPSDPYGLIARHLRAQATLVEERKLDGMKVERFDLNPGARFAPAQPQVKTNLRLGERIELRGYDLLQPELTGDKPLKLRLYWRASGPIDADYTVFLHLIGPDGGVYGQRDAMPGDGNAATSHWAVGQTVLDEHEIALAPDAPPGEYPLSVGLYDWRTGERLPMFDENGQQLPENRLVIAGLACKGTP